MSVFRFNISYLLDILTGPQNLGIILPGIVGSGKTFMIQELCGQLKASGFEVFSYAGDDTKFRSEVRHHSPLIAEDIGAAGAPRPMVYVDEVQKEAAIFDAIKISFDRSRAKFVVSGSNPALLRTMANDRLQRRGLVVTHFPFSLPEIFLHQGLISENFDSNELQNVLNSTLGINDFSFQVVPRHADAEKTTERYLRIGGLPDAWLSASEDHAKMTVKLVAERGITDTFQGTIAVDDEIRQFLAEQNSKEFTYKGLQQSLRTSKRHVVDRVLDHLLNHGYIYKKTPFLGSDASDYGTYFAIYSWVDPGLVSYYTTFEPSEAELGYRLESYIHTRLLALLEKQLVKSSIYYYKPYSLKKSSTSLIFGPGELDFVLKIGRKIMPVEVKKTAKIREIDTTMLESFIAKNKSEFGIVFYGGSTYFDLERKIVFYPYWLV
jgi:predicted AAA+ superfamily ATPase